MSTMLKRRIIRKEKGERMIARNRFADARTDPIVFKQAYANLATAWRDLPCGLTWNEVWRLLRNEAEDHRKMRAVKK